MVDALAREVRSAKTFSINHLSDHGHLADNSPLSQAITALDGAVTDLGGLANIVSNEDSTAILTKNQAREALEGRQHTASLLQWAPLVMPTVPWPNTVDLL